MSDASTKEDNESVRKIEEYLADKVLSKPEPKVADEPAQEAKQDSTGS
jgi:hypothetical protein